MNSQEEAMFNVYIDNALDDFNSKIFGENDERDYDDVFEAIAYADNQEKLEMLNEYFENNQEKVVNWFLNKN